MNNALMATNDDTYAWLCKQAEVLRSGQELNQAQREALAEFLGERAKAQRQEFESLTRMIFNDLLLISLNLDFKMHERLARHRADAQTMLEYASSLREAIAANFEHLWQLSCTGLLHSLKITGSGVELPSICPFTLEQVLDFDFEPETHLQGWRKETPPAIPTELVDLYGALEGSVLAEGDITSPVWPTSQEERDKRERYAKVCAALNRLEELHGSFAEQVGSEALRAKLLAVLEQPGSDAEKVQCLMELLQ